MTTFKDLGLKSRILESLDDLGFIEPTAVQVKTIPFILSSKKDLIALAQTGTGKTAAFGLPILNLINLNRNELQSIILCPTRELCIQISQDIKNLAKHSTGISVTSVYGGDSITRQINSLKRGTNIVVGTPGRVLDLIHRGALKLNRVEWLVLDEADEMLDMGFKEDLDSILDETPKSRQTLLFSATISKGVRQIAKNYMKDTEEISIGEKNIGAKNVSHEYYVVSPRDRFEALKRILDNLPGVYGILFCRTRAETQDIADKLKRFHYDAEAIHGDISQSMRTKIMQSFKSKEKGLLVATDVAARGIDVTNLSHVINYNLPDQSEGYTHRSGRTGRAQKSGVSISIVSPREVGRIRELERMIGKSFERKDVPNGEGICLKQIQSFVDEVENTDISDSNYEKYYVDIIDRLKKITKDDLIKHFITHRLRHLMEEYKNVRDLNVDDNYSAKREGTGNHVNLKINLGKEHGFDIKALFDLINSDEKLKGIQIGKIELQSNSSLFSVDKKYIDEVINYLNDCSFDDRQIKVSKSNIKATYVKKTNRRQGHGRSEQRGRRRRRR